MDARTACCDPTKDVRKRIDSLYGVIRTITLGGGEVVGFQPGPQFYLALFRHPLTASTLALPITELTPERVTDTIAQSVQARFDFGLNANTPN